MSPIGKRTLKRQCFCTIFIFYSSTHASTKRTMPLYSLNYKRSRHVSHCRLIVFRSKHPCVAEVGLHFNVQINLMAKVALRFYFCKKLFAKVALRFYVRKKVIAKDALRFVLQYSKNQIALRFNNFKIFCGFVRCVSVYSKKMPSSD